MEEGCLDIKMWIRNSHGNNIFPKISKPEAIGYFGIDAEQEYVDKPNFIGYLNVPRNLPIDLNIGIEQARRWKVRPNYDKLHALLKFINNNHQKILVPKTNGGLKLDAHVATCRGILTLIMSTPYERSYEYRLRVTKFNGVIYIAKILSETELGVFLNKTQEHKIYESWGYKFEQYCLSSAPNGVPETNAPFIETEEFICVFRTFLNGMTLLYSAEMDGIISNETVDLDDAEILRSLEFVELKTTSIKKKKHELKSYLYGLKCLKWWCQCFMAGVKTIQTGLRDDHGIVHKIERIKVPNLCCNNQCRPVVAVTFLEKFLFELKAVMDKIIDPYAVVELHYCPTQQCFKNKIIKEDEAEPPMIPDWYRKLMSY